MIIICNQGDLLTQFTSLADSKVIPFKELRIP